MRFTDPWGPSDVAEGEGTASPILVLSVEGKRGHERQALAVAARLGEPMVRRIAARGARSAPLIASATRLVIAAGRQAIAPARQIARCPAAPPVCVMQPVWWRPGDFALLWAPAHDRVRWGALPMVRTLTTPSPVTTDETENAVTALSERLAAAPPPRAGVLVGGPSRHHRFGRAEAAALGDRLSAFARLTSRSLIVTTAPRTTSGIVETLQERLAAVPHVLFDYAGEAQPEKAYAATLGAAERLIVTVDSVAMLSEAASTGLPVHAVRLPGGGLKHRRFLKALVAHGAVRWFDGTAAHWRYDAPDAAGEIAARLSRLTDLPVRAAARTSFAPGQPVSRFERR